MKIEMQFLPDVHVTCEVCEGRRYNRETLEVTFKGKNIADVLDLTIEEADRFFRAVPAIADRLAALESVGLGYLRLGQAANTLSGGEAQRVKLAAELAKKSTGRTVYLFDEPTTGLHFTDIAKLLEVFFKLRDAGNTLIVIEHNLEIIKCADWIIDLGPGGWFRGRADHRRGHAGARRQLARKPHGPLSGGEIVRVSAGTAGRACLCSISFSSRKKEGSRSNGPPAGSDGVLSAWPVR